MSKNPVNNEKTPLAVTHKKQKYEIAMTREEGEADWDVSVSLDGALLVRGMYGCMLELSEYGPNGARVEVSVDLYEKLHDVCENHVDEAALDEDEASEG